MRHVLFLLVAAASPLPAAAQTATEPPATIAAPTGGFARYDPTLSAREAVLANWELAASGIRAGAVVGGRVVEMADRDTPFGRLARQAETAQTTMLQRWNAAQWVYTVEPALARLDAGTFAHVAAAVAAPCAAEPCTAQADALRDAFAAATAQFAAAAADARAAIDARMEMGDAALMAEQLGVVAEYLGSDAWAGDFALTERGRDGEEVAARIVGAMSLWRNVEPYVGLTDPGIDRDINAAADGLLRTLRLETRIDGPLDPDGPEIAALRVRAAALAAEFRRAAALFAA